MKFRKKPVVIEAPRIGERLKWIVIVGTDSWAKCYGLFTSDDAAVAWLRANQFVPSDCGIYPVNNYDAKAL